MIPSWVDIDLEWWLAPSSERWSLDLYPSWVELDCGCLARCLPLLCEVVIGLVVHCLCERLRLWFAPSSERWSLNLYPSWVEVDCGCLARCLPLLCKVVIVLVGERS